MPGIISFDVQPVDNDFPKKFFLLFYTLNVDVYLSLNICMLTPNNAIEKHLYTS